MPLIKPSISELPALPLTVPLLKMVGELIGLFMEDGILGSDATVPKTNPRSKPHVTAFRWLRQFTEIRPEVFFRNDMQKKCTASCPTSGALPRDAQIVSLNMYDTGLNNEAEGCFPYVRARLGNARESSIMAHVSNSNSVNFKCRAEDVHLSLMQARSIVRKVSVRINWISSVAFIGASLTRRTPQ